MEMSVGILECSSPRWLQLQKIITHPSTGSHLDSGGQVCWDVGWSNVIDSSVTLSHVTGSNSNATQSFMYLQTQLRNSGQWPTNSWTKHLENA